MNGTTTTRRTHRCCQEAESAKKKHILIDHSCLYQDGTLPSGRKVVNEKGQLLHFEKPRKTTTTTTKQGRRRRRRIRRRRLGRNDGWDDGEEGGLSSFPAGAAAPAAAPAAEDFRRLRQKREDGWYGEQASVPWFPELPDRTGEGESPWTAVMREVDRSFGNFRDPTVDLLDMLKCESNFILLVNGRVFVSSKFDQLGASKPRYHLTMIKSVIESLPDNSIYVVDLGARGGAGSVRKRCGAKVPLFVIAKRQGYDSSPGILIPNPYFANLTRWDAKRRDIHQGLTPWASRRQKAVWRGAVGCSDDMCEGDLGNWRRLLAVVQSWKRPDLLDFKVVGEGNRVRNPAVTNCSRSGLEIYPEVREAYDELAQQNFRPFFADYVDIPHFARYQFALSLPGVMGGSYSRHLNNLWDLDLVVFIGVRGVWSSRSFLPSRIPRLLVGSSGSLARRICCFSSRKKKRLFLSSSSFERNPFERKRPAARKYENYRETFLRHRS